ncbi:unnamed protein product [Alopecurus aequalis]
MRRQPCCDKVGLKKGPWTAEEDQRLVAFLITHGHYCWRLVPKLAGLIRCGKSCRLRWTNYLRPDLKRGLLSDDEERLVVDMHAMGIDPDTHRPLLDQQDQALPTPVQEQQQDGAENPRQAEGEDRDEKAVPMIQHPNDETTVPQPNCSASPASAIFSPSCSSSSASASGVDVAEWPQPTYPFGMDGFMDVGSVWDAGFFVSGVDPVDHYDYPVDSGFEQQDWF